jgi:hypothetical protein
MTQAQFYTLLETSGFPVAYHSWKSDDDSEAPEPPYIVYLSTGSNNIGADNKVKVKVNRYLVELYTNKKDIGAEQTLENVFDSASLFYNKSESYIESESMFQISYQFEI